MSYVDVADRVGDRVLNTLKRVQDLTVSTVSTVTERVATFVPELPTIPLADRFPRPREVAEKTFGFWEELLETQKDYTLKLIDAFEPLASKVDSRRSRPKKSSKPAEAKNQA